MDPEAIRSAWEVREQVVDAGHLLASIWPARRSIAKGSDLSGWPITSRHCGRGSRSERRFRATTSAKPRRPAQRADGNSVSSEVQERQNDPVKIGDEDPETYRKRLEVKLDPENIRATLGFAGLYQITHELIKAAVLDEVRQFFWRGFDGGTHLYDEPAYAEHVLAKEPRNRFRASLLWLVECEALSSLQADRLDEIYAHRHALSHELIKYVIDPGLCPRRRPAHRRASDLEIHPALWTSVENDIGSFEDFGDVDLDEVIPLSLSVLQICIDAYVNGLPPSQ